MAERFDNYDGTGLALGVAAVLAGASLWGQMEGGGGADGSRAKKGASTVTAAWAHGESAKAGAISTDGENLYSYALRIGTTDSGGRKVLSDYTSSGEFRSTTTSQHVGAAKVYADLIVDPRARSILD